VRGDETPVKGKVAKARSLLSDVKFELESGKQMFLSQKRWTQELDEVLNKLTAIYNQMTNAGAR